MQSVLIAGGSESQRTRKAEEICDELHVESLEKSIFRPPEDITSPEDAFGIALVRRIKQKAFLKPSRGTFQAILIFEAEKLTLPAQHALLKLLEEPPHYTIIILAASNKDSILATIRSRCKILLLQKETVNTNHSLSESEIPSNYSIKESLMLSEKIAKTDPKTWISNYIQTIHTLFISQVGQGTDLSGMLHTRDILTRSQDAYVLLSTSNTNPRLVLEHLLFGIRKGREYENN